MSPTKRERRLAEAVAQISARASERYPDEGSASQRQRAAIRRDAFVKGALWWRYREAADTRDTKPADPGQADAGSLESSGIDSSSVDHANRTQEES